MKEQHKKQGAPVFGLIFEAKAVWHLWDGDGGSSSKNPGNQLKKIKPAFGFYNAKQHEN